MYNLKIRTLAQQDIQEIIDYHDKINAKITNHFLNNLFTKLETIQTTPLIFSEKYKKTRVAYLKKFPFGIHFLIDNKTIHILAIIHTSRNPNIWQKR